MRSRPPRRRRFCCGDVWRVYDVVALREGDHDIGVGMRQYGGLPRRLSIWFPRMTRSRERSALTSAIAIDSTSTLMKRISSFLVLIPMTVVAQATRTDTVSAPVRDVHYDVTFLRP